MPSGHRGCRPTDQADVFGRQRSAIFHWSAGYSDLDEAVLFGCRCLALFNSGQIAVRYDNCDDADDSRQRNYYPTAVGVHIIAAPKFRLKIDQLKRHPTDVG